MLSAISWYLLITALGWLVFPLAFRLLPGLPDRGYAISRTFGLLLTGYLYWLLASLGLLNNSLGGMMFILLLVTVLVIIIYRRSNQTSGCPGEWLREHLLLVAVVELVFAAAFAGWVLVRAYNPHVFYTEKLMELAFLNGVRNSPAFPPRDPWLSGYAISYYYFGYVIIAIVADLTATATGTAFNLGIALLFALTVVNSYGLVYNLAAAHFQEKTLTNKKSLPVLASLVGPVLVVLMGNLAGLLELIRSLALRPFGAQFWAWLDIIDMDQAFSARVWPPSTWRFWWWFRASRVIHDRGAGGISSGVQPIDEFPAFSFLLGDMHPHVLAVAFVIMALVLAFNALNQKQSLQPVQAAVYILVFGGLAFLNTWDLPIYLFILLGALVLAAAQRSSKPGVLALLKPTGTAAIILFAGILAYLPWYISFGSQAGGILPNALFATRFHQLFVMFGPLLFIAGWLVIDLAVHHRKQTDWATGVTASVGLLAVLIAFTVVLSAVAVRQDPGVMTFAVNTAGYVTEGLTTEEIAALVPEAVQTTIFYRLAHPITPLVMALLLAGCIALLVKQPYTEETQSNLSRSTLFSLLLIATAVLLILGPEFLYLRDNFGQRMNTIFKFYFAAWILLGTASGYGLINLLIERRGRIRLVFGSAAGLLIAAGLVYTVLAIPGVSRDSLRAADEQPPTLDGTDWIRRRYPEDYGGMLWLMENAAPDDIVLEAIGGSYTYYARVSSVTGIPTLMGWPGHEGQWRGPAYTEFAGSRVADVQEIYSTLNAARARELIEQYRITYIFVGSLERDPNYAPAAGIAKFDDFLTTVYRNDGVIIYRADQPLVKDTE
nr:hypothetical protein [Anaerolineae bacterium]